MREFGQPIRFPITRFGLWLTVVSEPAGLAEYYCTVVLPTRTLFSNARIANREKTKGKNDKFFQTLAKMTNLCGVDNCMFMGGKIVLLKALHLSLH